MLRSSSTRAMVGIDDPQAVQQREYPADAAAAHQADLRRRRSWQKVSSV
jgi:hypothetical protein